MTISTMPASERQTRRARAVFALGALVLAQTRALAAEPAGAARGPQSPAAPFELRHTEPTSLALELAASVAFSGSMLLAAGPPASRCTWCSAGAFDEGARDALRARNPRSAAALSHAFANASAPALALAALVPPALMQGRSEHALENFVILADSVILTFGVTHAAKRLTDRARPAVRHGAVGDTQYDASPSEWNQSFLSGHTSLAFALGSSAATLSFLRGYPSAPWVVFGGSILGVGAGCLRIAADLHWATDVLAGAAVGTAVGISVPLLLHPRAGTPRRAFTLLPVVGRRELGIVTGSSW